MARTSEYGDKKVAVLNEIDAAARRHSRVPTVRELAATFQVSTATMHSWLTKMAGEGLVTWEQGRHRSLRPSPKGSQLLSQPVGP